MDNFKQKFCGSGGDLCYYPLLYKALEETKNHPLGIVYELGMGHGSTPLLNEYCTINERILRSFDFSEEWRSKFDGILNKFHHSILISEYYYWDKVYKEYSDASVIFIDQSPGEERKETIKAYQHIKGILVIHDTEPTGAGDYRVRPLFPLFKYIAEVPTAGAWATALSNEIDVTKWAGEQFGEWVIKAGIQQVTPETTDQRK